jgi:hypothetical protein
VLPKRRDSINRFLDQGNRLCFGSIDGAKGGPRIGWTAGFNHLAGDQTVSRVPTIGNQPPTPIAYIDEETNCRSVGK